MKPKELKLINETLLRIVRDDISFRASLKMAFKDNKLEQYVKNIISNTVGAELRRHFLFSYIFKKEFPDIKVEELTLLSVLLSNKLFSKKIEHEELLKFTLNELKNNESLITKKDVENILLKYEDPSNLIGEDVARDSIEFLELRYNTPRFMIKMWQKHFSKGLTYKILKANQKQPLTYVRVNNLSASKEEILKDNESFALSEVDNILLYQNKRPLRENRHYQLCDIFTSSPAVKSVLDMIEIDSFKPVAVYQGSPNENLFLEVMMKGNKNLKLDLILQSDIDYNRINPLINKYGLARTNVYTAKPSEVVTCLSSKVDTFIIWPKSSNFQMIRLDPDYVLHFKSECLDELIKDQNKLIDEAYLNLDEGGQLLYLVSTLNKKESNQIIKDFLIRHEDMHLLKDGQYFPFDKYDSTLYFALLKKEVKNND